MADVKEPKIALGAWAWGNDGTFGGQLGTAELQPVVDAAMKEGLNLFVTSFAYGAGTSEKGLAELLKGYGRDEYLVSDKLTPQCAGMAPEPTAASMYEMQLSLMGLDRFDVYWIHNTVDAPKWITQVAEYFDGRDDAPVIGVSNHNLAEIEQADAICREHGLRIGAVQNHYSLINRSSEDSGILNWCRENGADFYAYMVLEQGALSGKYGTANPMPVGSARAEAYNPILDKLDVMNAALSEVAEARGVGAAQVPVAWAIAKGTLPLIGVTKVSHVEDAVAAAGIELTAEEIAHLEQVADSLELDVIRFWEKKMD